MERKFSQNKSGNITNSGKIIEISGLTESRHEIKSVIYK